MHRFPGMLGLLQLSPPDMPVTQKLLLSSSCLQQEYHNAPHGAHRTGEFPCIRLLNDRVFVRDTIDTFGMSYIMAMSVKQTPVAEFFSSAFTLGGKSNSHQRHFPCCLRKSTPLTPVLAT